jgi:hypothetical protein
MLIMTKTDLKALRARLPKGYALTLAQSLNLSKRTIHAVLHGERNNQTVVDAAELLAAEYQKNVREKILSAASG